MDGYELRVLMYQEGWSGPHFIDTSQWGISACRVEATDLDANCFVGLYVEGLLTHEGAWSRGMALYFNHNNADCPRLLRAHASHWLRKASEGEFLCDLVSDPKEEEIPPEGCVELVPNLSEYDGRVTSRSSAFLYRREYTCANINGVEITATSLVQALAYASFMSIPLESHEELLSLSKLPNTFSSAMFSRSKEDILDRIRSS